MSRGVIVLPLTGDAESIGRRITAQAESLLTWIPGVRVAPAAMAPRRLHSLGELREVATLVNVANVLYGDVAMSGHQLRVQIRLGAMPDDSSLWSADMTRDSSEITALAREIADSVGRILNEMPATDRAVIRIPQAPLPLRSAKQRAELSRELAAKGDLEEAIREARRARELDPLSRDYHVSYIQLLERAGRKNEARRDSALLARLTRYLRK